MWFEDWWYKYQYETSIEVQPYEAHSDLKAAYIAGFDACRDKWGGLTYEQTIEDEKQ
jgi:hypothetical protein